MRRLSMQLLLVGAISITAPTGSAGEPVSQNLQGGLALYEAGKLEQAQAFLEQSLKDHPGDAWATHYLGRIRFDLDDADRAIELFEEAVELSPRVSEFHLWLGRAYLHKLAGASMFKKLGLSKQVRASYLEAIEIDPDNFEARESLAGYYFEAPAIAGGSTAKGNEQVDAIRARDPKLAHRVMGSHYLDKEQYDLAEQEFNAALALAPEDAELQFRLGLLYQATERYDDAFAAFERMMALEPENMSASYQIGRTASLTGKNLDRGIECLKAYLEHEPDRGAPSLAWAHYRLGLVYMHKGDRSAERREYEAALRLDPDHDEAKKALKKLS